MHYEEWLLVLYHHTTSQKVLYHQLSLASCSISAGWLHSKVTGLEGDGILQMSPSFLAPDPVVHHGKQKDKRFKVEWQDIASYS